MAPALDLIDVSDSLLASDEGLASDEELFDRSRSGDGGAFEVLYRRHRPSARRLAGLCTNSAADAEDAVAEGFARVFAALPRLHGREIVFRAYLYAAVRNAATDGYRRRARLDVREMVSDERIEAAADEAVLRRCEDELMEEALATLPARWRVVLWLTEVEGLGPVEVSERIGIKPNAASALAYRSRRGLRQAYFAADSRAASA